MPLVNRTFFILKRCLYFSLPVLLLYLIVKRVDFVQLLDTLQKTNPLYILIGIGIRPLQIIFGAFRWRILNNYYSKEKLSLSYMLGQYWSGMAVGFFTPSNLGWDAYRIMRIGKKIESYTSAFVTIVAEKFLGLFSILIMCLVMFPIVQNKIIGDISLYINIYYIVLTSFLGVILIIALSVRFNNQKINIFIKSWLNELVSKLANFMKSSDIYKDISTDYANSNSILSFLKQPAQFLNAFIFSVGILIIAATCSQLIFQGLDYELSYAINLFAAPALFIIFIVPISFGSIGVREGAFILLYGQFGVPIEVALLVSFFNLFGLFLNNIIGSIILMWQALKGY